MQEYEKYHSIFTDYLTKNRITLNTPIQFQRLVMRSGRDPEARRALLARNRALKVAFNSESKIDKLEEILRENRNERVIIFTQHNDLVYRISRRFLIPFITHTTNKEERHTVLELFNSGEYWAVVTSKVLDEGIDVPEASLGIILSGTGSLREFVQRLGRVLRKKTDRDAKLIEIVSSETTEVNTSSRRRRGRPARASSFSSPSEEVLSTNPKRSYQ